MRTNKFTRHKRNTNSVGRCLAGAIYIAIVVALVVGYIGNLVAFVRCDFEPSYKAEVLHGVGIVVPPVGAVFGYCDFGK
jgi:hypothetical protein